MQYTSVTNPLNKDLFICTPFTQCWDGSFNGVNPPFRTTFNWIDNFSDFIIDNLGDEIVFKP